jgi:hypothetical protein
MEFQELADEKAPLLSRFEVLRSKYTALAFNVINCLVSIFLVTRFAIRWSHAAVRPAIISQVPSPKEIAFLLVFIILPTPLSLFSAWRLSRRVTLDPRYRRAVLWVVQLAMATFVFWGNMMLYMILMFESRYF